MDLDPAAPAVDLLAKAPLDEAPKASAPEAEGETRAPLPTLDGATKVKTRKPSAETTFRVLFNEQMDLTALADSKANMMIQINGLIISIMLASSSIILGARPWLSLPSASLASTALISIVFAVLAARPKLNKPATLSVEDVYSGRANILFFGRCASSPGASLLGALPRP